MIYSLSQIEAQAQKAVRGAGFDWGHAQEAGKAVRWLSAQNLPGASLLAKYLQQHQSHPQQYQAPQMEPHLWHPANQAFLCPLRTGACLCDFNQPTPESPVVLERVAHPLLLLPYLAHIAEHAQATAEVHWSGVRVHCRAQRLHRIQDEQLKSPLAASVECLLVSHSLLGKDPCHAGQTVEDNTWQILEQFAHETYVPASEASRRGAGPAD